MAAGVGAAVDSIDAVCSRGAAAVAVAVHAVDGVDAAVAVCSRGAAAVAVAVGAVGAVDAADADVAVCSRGAAAVDAGSRHILFGSLVPSPHFVLHVAE